MRVFLCVLMFVFVISLSSVTAKDISYDWIWSMGINAMDVGDLDADGDYDVVLGVSGYYWSQIVIRDNSGIWYYGVLSDSQRVTAIKIGDADNDGENEIVVYLSNAHGDNGRTRVYDIVGDSLVLGGEYIYGNYVLNQALAIGDYDNDGTNEIVIGYDFYTREVSAYTFSGGTFNYEWGDNIGSDVRSVTIGDVDNDGENELLVGTACWNAWDVRIYDGGVVTWAEDIFYGSQFEGVCIGDVDNDGNNEFAGAWFSEVAHNVDSGGVVVYKYQAGSYTKIWDYGLNAAARNVGIFDVDNDGYNELVCIEGPFVGNSGEYKVDVFDNFVLTQSAVINYHRSWACQSQALKIVDFDASGSKELFVLMPMRVIRLEVTPSKIDEKMFNFYDGLTITLENPIVQNKITAEIFVPKEGNYTIKLVDSLGRIVKYFMKDKKLKVGDHKYTFELKRNKEVIPSGVYFLVVSSEGLFAKKTVKINKL